MMLETLIGDGLAMKAAEHNAFSAFTSLRIDSSEQMAEY